MDNRDKMIESVRVTRVANGHVIQVKLVGISTELTFVSDFDEDLVVNVGKAITKALVEKI